MSNLTHLDSQGHAHMVDVSEKDITTRVAHAEAFVEMMPETLALITQGKHKKGDVLAVARIAGIQAAKKCSDLIVDIFRSKTPFFIILEGSFQKFKKIKTPIKSLQTSTIH